MMVKLVRRAQLLTVGVLYISGADFWSLCQDKVVEIKLG